MNVTTRLLYRKLRLIDREERTRRADEEEKEAIFVWTGLDMLAIKVQVQATGGLGRQG